MSTVDAVKVNVVTILHRITIATLEDTIYADWLHLECQRFVNNLSTLEAKVGVDSFVNAL